MNIKNTSSNTIKLSFKGRVVEVLAGKAAVIPDEHALAVLKAFPALKEVATVVAEPKPIEGTKDVIKNKKSRKSGVSTKR